MGAAGQRDALVREPGAAQARVELGQSRSETPEVLCGPTRGHVQIGGASETVDAV
ncbi:MAG: hypothetical protein ACYDAD_07775 [Acidimicrobiales bacterium]